MQSVLIAVQARSTSSRLPRKAQALIGGKTILDRVLEACKRAALYLNKSPKRDYKARVAVLVPYADAILEDFASRIGDILEGPEDDVLTRYAMALDHYEPDLVVRVTGDCPLIPPQVISKMVIVANKGRYDYLSNVDPRFRTAIDGVDCEVISARLLAEAVAKARDPFDREHVTPWIRREPPDWAKVGAVVDTFDFSHLKLSVDTPEDLERVRAAFESADAKYQAAVALLGQHEVHRL